jgi:hypothetical protein
MFTGLGFPESVRRHFERLDVFPRGLLPIGQGMSVAALEARLLQRLLENPGGDINPIAGLAPANHPQSLPALPSASRYNFKRHFGLEFNNYFRSALTLRGVSSLSIRLGNACDDAAPLKPCMSAIEARANSLELGP